MTNIIKNITFIIALTVLVGCGPPEWEEKGFTGKKSYKIANDLGITTGDEWRSYKISGCWGRKSQVARHGIVQDIDDVDLWRKSPEVCFKRTEDRIKAEKYNIYSQEEWFNALEASKLGGFYSMDNYLKAKKLNIETQAELTKYEYNEMLLSGMRTAGAYYAVNEMCQDISRYLIASTNYNSDKRLFLSLAELFDRKNSLDMSKINPLNDDESSAFENAKNNEFGNFYNQLNANTSNQKWLMDYLTKNCAPRMIQICDVSRARNDRSVVKTCDDLSAYGL